LNKKILFVFLKTYFFERILFVSGVKLTKNQYIAPAASTIRDMWPGAKAGGAANSMFTIDSNPASTPAEAVSSGCVP